MKKLFTIRVRRIARADFQAARIDASDQTPLDPSIALAQLILLAADPCLRHGALVIVSFYTAAEPTR